MVNITKQHKGKENDYTKSNAKTNLFISSV